MSTERAGSFHADPTAVSALAEAHRGNGAELSAQVSQVTAAATMLHPDALGPIGAVFANALVEAADRHADRVAELSGRLAAAADAAAGSAASFVAADGRVATNLGGLR